jgi:hypothetical protein
MLWRWVALGVCGSWSVLALLWSAICAWLGAQGLCVQEHPPPTATSGALFPLNHLCPPLKPRSRLWGWPQTEQLSPADQQQCMLRLQTLMQMLQQLAAMSPPASPAPAPPMSPLSPAPMYGAVSQQADMFSQQPPQYSSTPDNNTWQQMMPQVRRAGLWRPLRKAGVKDEKEKPERRV